MFSLLKPNILKVVPEQIKAQPRRAVTSRHFLSLPLVMRKRGLPEKRPYNFYLTRKRMGWREGGLPGSFIFPLAQGPTAQI